MTGVLYYKSRDTDRDTQRADSVKTETEAGMRQPQVRESLEHSRSWKKQGRTLSRASGASMVLPTP